jgi:hypothetical protein
MKKDLRDQKQKLRRLGLSRETIRLLDDPALLGLVRGGLNEGTHSSGASCTTTRTMGVSDTSC